MTSVNDFKIFLKVLINSSRRKSGKAFGATVREIKKDLAYLEHIDVDEFVKENGHQNLLDLINEWEEFTVHYDTFEPTVRVKCEDHISKMNKYSKQKRGTTNSIAKKINSPEHLKVTLRPDPYSFSPESSIDVFLHDTDSQNFRELTELKETSLSLSSGDDSDDLQYFNMMFDSKTTSNKTDGTTQNDSMNQETLTNNRKELSTQEIHQIIPVKMMSTTSKAVSKNSVIQSLIQQTPKQKLSLFKNINSSKIQFKLVKTIDKLILSCRTLDPKTQNVVSIAMLDVVNPHRFWFAEYEEYKALDVLMKNMQEFYAVNQDSLRISAQDLQRGLYVAAMYDGIWHRGVIVKKYDNFARISYVDFGTAYDMRHIDLCYLKEDFLNLPSIARRGVLGFIQPCENNEWNVEASSFFESCIKNKKIEAKIFKHNSRDNSYCLGIKYKNEQKAQELLTKTMISNNFAKADSKFLENDPVSNNSYEFQDYENGILLDINTQTSNAIEAFDSWLPFKKIKTPDKVINTSIPLSTPNSNNSNKKRSAKKAFTTPDKNDQSLITSIPKVSEDIKRNLTNEFNTVAGHDEKQIEIIQDSNVVDITEGMIARQQSSRSISQAQQNRSQSNLSNSVNQVFNESSNSWLVKKQSFQKLTVGDNIEIFIHVIYDASCFFFYVKNEMLEIKKFLDDLNASCKQFKENLSDEELMVNKECVVFNDKNYCRARINSKNESLYQVFLIDFGISATKKRKEIYLLHKEYTKRQSCIYKGSTQHPFPINRLTNTKTYIVAKILGIRNEDTVDIKFEAFN